MQFHDLVESLKPPTCCNDYCFLRMYIECSHKDPTHQRILVQLKCIERFKWLLGEELDRDISWEEASIFWVQRGYAKSFGDAYDPDCSVDEMWELCITFISSESTI